MKIVYKYIVKIFFKARVENESRVGPIKFKKLCYSKYTTLMYKRRKTLILRRKLFKKKLEMHEVKYTLS